MTPQLFINYKLKSVAHLPWRMLTYKALNTFIDDIFAFVIKMPTMYRIGCFRDGRSRCEVFCETVNTQSILYLPPSISHTHSQTSSSSSFSTSAGSTASIQSV